MNKFKVLITFPYFIHTYLKARKMTRKVLKDPNLVSEETRYLWLQKRCRYFAWLYDVKVDVEGIENWPKQKPCVIVANHQSNFDPLLLFLINDFSKFAPMAFIAKQELLKDRLFKNFVQLIDVLFLDRDNPRKAVEVFNEAKVLIRVPRTLVIFPEGTRSHGATLQEFKAAALQVAYKAYVPIVPVAILNSYEVFDKKFQGRKRIKIVFQKAIDPIDFININSLKLANSIQNNIQKAVDNFAVESKQG